MNFWKKIEEKGYCISTYPPENPWDPKIGIVIETGGEVLDMFHIERELLEQRLQEVYCKIEVKGEEGILNL